MSKQICPYCDDYKDVIVVEKQDTIIVRKKAIPVIDKYLKCLDCQGVWDDPKSDYDVLEQAYLEHNRLYPDDSVRIKDSDDVRKDMKIE